MSDAAKLAGDGMVLLPTWRLLECGKPRAPRVPAHWMKAPGACPAPGAAAGAAKPTQVVTTMTC